jgi:7-carboxy-7-deazaguanine synthase
VGTDGQGGGKFETAAELATACVAAMAGAATPGLLVMTGGEPMLQVDQPLLDALHDAGFAIAIETNGTLAVPDDVDWVCVSPKAGADLKQMRGDELKLVYPQPALLPDAVGGLDFDHFFLQPMDGPAQAANTVAAIDYCKANPPWRLSVQTHKVLGIR